MKKPALLLLILFASLTTFAQRPTLSDQETVSQAVIAEVDALFASEDFTKKKSRRFPDVSGIMTVDIGVVQNGKVSTFFKAESDISNIDFIDFMSQYILDHKFRFKLPKKQRYKIRHTLKF